MQHDLRGLLDFCFILYQSFQSDDIDVVFIVGNGVGRGKCCLKILRPRIQSLKHGDAKARRNPGWLHSDCQELPQVCQSLSCMSLQLEKVRRFTEHLLE